MCIRDRDITTPTPENVAKAILKDIRSKGTVASLSGISAIGGQLGVSKFSMSGSFTNDQTAVFSIEGSTLTYSAGGNETAAQARDRLLTNPGTGEFQGSKGEIIEVISSGKLKISDKTGKSLFKAMSDIIIKNKEMITPLS